MPISETWIWRKLGSGSSKPFCGRRTDFVRAGAAGSATGYGGDRAQGTHHKTRARSGHSVDRSAHDHCRVNARGPIHVACHDRERLGAAGTGAVTTGDKAVTDLSL